LRVLLVDDSPAFLRALRNLLEGWTWTEILDVAHSGEQAVERVRELRPDLVLMDISMPGMGGLEATRRIKAEPGAPRVVFVSLEDRSAFPAIQGLGGDGFVSKSEVFEGLMPAIERLFPGLVRGLA
jgi:CheY-like chemotaxis protein